MINGTLKNFTEYELQYEDEYGKWKPVYVRDDVLYSRTLEIYNARSISNAISMNLNLVSALQRDAKYKTTRIISRTVYEQVVE